MIQSKVRLVFLGAVFLLPACAFMEEALWPSLTGEDPAGRDKAAASAKATAQKPAQPAETTVVSGQPPLGTGNFQPTGVTPGAPTGTAVGKRVDELREDLKKLQGNIAGQNGALQQVRAKLVQDSQRYHGTIAAVQTRLQVGTTPGNPILVQQFNSAQADLDRLAADIAEMNKLAADVAGSSTLSAYLADAARATRQLSGAVDEDHRQLAVLEDEVDRTVVLIDRLLKEVSLDVRRQTNYVATERANLNVVSAGVKAGEIYGVSLASVANSATAKPTAGQPLDIAGRRPLVVIRFDRNDVPYQQALYSAVSRVLERRPDATFDLVAVAPAEGGPAREALNANKSRRLAEGVLRSLVDMGLPPARVAMSSKTLAQAKVNEVHLYLR
jgi:hypothetical protein